MDTPFEQAPALPPGPSLLDDNESNMLDNFFYYHERKPLYE
jgi:hypothetical protein